MLIELLTNVKPIMKCWFSCWLTSANGIQDGRLGCVRLLASANDIQDGWLGCVRWLASLDDLLRLMASKMDDMGFDWWLALANSILRGWPR